MLNLTHAHAQNIDQAPALIKSTQFYVPQPGPGPGHYMALLHSRQFGCDEGTKEALEKI